jgi:hypothetical protein
MGRLKSLELFVPLMGEFLLVVVEPSVLADTPPAGPAELDGALGFCANMSTAAINATPAKTVTR